jgi:hypothetical protein
MASKNVQYVAGAKTQSAESVEMNFLKWWQTWRCKMGKHNWTDKPGGRIQCTDPGCGRYLQ